MTQLFTFFLLVILSYLALAQTKPNIILIVADYMGYADIEPYGSTDIKTPSLNQLAVEGAKFTNHYAAASVCIPSRASLLSGLYPNKALQGFESTRGRGLHVSNNHLLIQLKAASN
jgi:membrane-anchored protein YejM (alkaline phosphatase superfamily)